MTTQSQLVDEMVAESLRPDMLMTISSFVSQVIRELHQEPQSKAAVGFSDNLHEVQLVANTNDGFLWPIPRPHLFQKMAMVWYDRFAKAALETKPQHMHLALSPAGPLYYYYRTGAHIAFGGYGGENAGIKVAWYEYPRNLDYVPKTARLVEWNNDLQEFKFKDETLTLAEKEALLLKYTNWILSRHTELVKQGLRAKIYARLGQYDRARLAYSQYEALRPGMVSAETSDSTSVYIGL